MDLEIHGVAELSEVAMADTTGGESPYLSVSDLFRIVGLLLQNGGRIMDVLQ